MSLIRKGLGVPALGSWIEDFFSGDSFFSAIGKEMSPAVNIKETDSAFHLEVATPGFKKEDIQIEVHDGVMTISAENKSEKEEKSEKDGTYTRKEFQYSSFHRSFTLPENTKEEDIKASYKDGVLNLTLNKSEAQKKPEKKKVNIS